MAKSRGGIIKYIVLGVIVAVVGGAIGIFASNFMSGSSNTPTFGGTNASGTNTATATTGSISKSVSGDGTLGAQYPEDITTLVDITITQMPIKLGSAVSRGDIIARIDKSKLTAAIALLKANLNTIEAQVKSLSGSKQAQEIYSPVSGRIKQLFAEKGDDVLSIIQLDGALAMLSTDGLMQVTFTPDSWDNLRAGTAVTVKNERGTSWDGRIASVARADNYVKVTFTDNGPKVDEYVSVYMGAIIGSGQAKINQPLAITSSGGQVSAVYKSEGTSVSKGSSLFSLTDVPLSDDYAATLIDRQDKLDQINAALELMQTGVIVAPENGIVQMTYVTSGEDVKANAPLISLAPRDQLELIVSVDELDIVSIREGQDASVSIDALPDQAFLGNVTAISAVGKSNNGITTYDVTLQIDNTPQMRIGMNASATISVQTKDNVLLVPLSALTQVSGRSYVNIPTGGTDAATGAAATQRVQVTTGLSDDSNVEILSGLTAGMQVVLPTSARSSSTQQQMMGLPGMGGGPVVVQQNVGSGNATFRRAG